MSLTMDGETVAFTPCSGASWRSPWRMYERLRDFDPVHHVIPEDAPENDYWVLSRYADISAAARAFATFSSAKGLTIAYSEMDDVGLASTPPLVMQDPPEHTAFRRMVAKGFTPRQATAIEPLVREFVIDRIEGLRAQSGGDVMAALFKPLPTMVVAEYLGVPEQDRDRFDRWTEAIVEGADADGPRPNAATATAELFGYFTELIERRRVEPGDDTVSHLLAAGLGGDVSGVRSILGFAFTMVTGGDDTVTGLLGEAVQRRGGPRHRDRRPQVSRVSRALQSWSPSRSSGAARNSLAPARRARCPHAPRAAPGRLPHLRATAPTSAANSPFRRAR